MASEGVGNPFMVRCWRTLVLEFETKLLAMSQPYICLQAYALSSKPSYQTPPPAAPTRRRLSPAAKAATSPAAAAATTSTGAPGSNNTPAQTPAGVPEKLGSHPLRLILLGHNPSAHACEHHVWQAAQCDVHGTQGEGGGHVLWLA
jgi:hypothetical protein